MNNVLQAPANELSAESANFRTLVAPVRIAPSQLNDDAHINIPVERRTVQPMQGSIIDEVTQQEYQFPIREFSNFNKYDNPTVLFINRSPDSNAPYSGDRGFAIVNLNVVTNYDLGGRAQYRETQDSVYLLKLQSDGTAQSVPVKSFKINPAGVGYAIIENSDGATKNELIALPSGSSVYKGKYLSNLSMAGNTAIFGESLESGLRISMYQPGKEVQVVCENIGGINGFSIENFASRTSYLPLYGYPSKESGEKVVMSLQESGDEIKISTHRGQDVHKLLSGGDIGIKSTVYYLGPQHTSIINVGKEYPKYDSGPKTVGSVYDVNSGKSYSGSKDSVYTAKVAESSDIIESKDRSQALLPALEEVYFKKDYGNVFLYPLSEGADAKSTFLFAVRFRKEGDAWSSDFSLKTERVADDTRELVRVSLNHHIWNGPTTRYASAIVDVNTRQVVSVEGKGLSSLQGS